MIDVQVTVG